MPSPHETSCRGATSGTGKLTAERVRRAYQRARTALLAERNDRGHWTGELSTSALSTATAVMALEMVRRRSAARDFPHLQLITGGLAWLAEHQNDDGGWGDTTKSVSNISTTMLAHAVFYATREHWEASGTACGYDAVRDRASRYIDDAGGVPAVVARYGKDKTFSVPILTHCALAGLVDWRQVQQLPFELACLPPQFYRTVRLPVVSYALPALIAIGQVRHHYLPTKVPGLRWLRHRARGKSLDVLQRIQPSNGGFLEATPLTSFVTMSLAGMGLIEHPVVRKGIGFIAGSVRDDGSWPIDTNLATWVTTLSVNALGPDLPDDAREPILRWLLDQQYKEVHPFTNADPGGWSWTDLPGGVPDADDTPGAILAVLELAKRRRANSGASGADRSESGGRRRGGSMSFRRDSQPESSAKSPAAHLREPGDQRSVLPDELVLEAHEAVRCGVKWLLDIQNRDGGWPTFCRGWGRLPFDRSSPDITAHCIRATASVFLLLHPDHQTTPAILTGESGAWHGNWITPASLPDGFGFRIPRAIDRAFRFVTRRQHSDGGWRPLWFGNQHSRHEQNLTYGTAKVLAAYRRCRRSDPVPLESASRCLVRLQNPDGGFGGDLGCPSSTEETALAVEALLADPEEASQLAAQRGLLWLTCRVEDGTYREPTPIGFYFAKLWYFERLYPLIFTVAALRRACLTLESAEESRMDAHVRL